MKQKRTCSNCIKGTAIAINSDILCREKGAVSPDYICTKHRNIPDSKSYKEMNYRCIDCEYFILNALSSDDPSTIGLCQLFSVRQYNGKQKNICSKFTKKSISYVS